MSPQTPIALVLALLSTTLTNLAYAREHDIAARLPTLSIRRPLRALELLLANRAWLHAFLLESTGFGLYAAALALASLALVQSVAAGGIGILAYISARRSRRKLSRRELIGAGTSILGLCALGASLVGGHAPDGRGDLPGVLIWLGATVAVALVVLRAAPRRLGAAATNGLAGGLLFSVGDISTKLATEGGARAAFAVLLMAGYGAGTTLLQIGYQSGGAVTVAGLATLLTNALPIVAGTIVLGEPVPSGGLGAVRALAFAAVTAGAVVLARPGRGGARASDGAGGASAEQRPPDDRLTRSTPGLTRCHRTAL